MINAEKIVFNEPLYFTPDYGGTIKISIVKLLDDKRALVRQYCKSKDLKLFSMPIVHIYNSNKDASNGRRAWEAYICARGKRSRKMIAADRAALPKRITQGDVPSLIGKSAHWFCLTCHKWRAAPITAEGITCPVCGGAPDWNTRLHWPI